MEEPYRFRRNMSLEKKGECDERFIFGGEYAFAPPRF